MNNELRSQLTHLVQDNNGTHWYVPELFAAHTVSALPSEITVVSAPPQEKENYNCFLYALGLHTNKEILDNCNGFIYSAFIQTLITEHQLEQITNPTTGCIILYSEQDTDNPYTTHAGIMKHEQTVISKWSWGPLLEHAIYDVPDTYGSHIRFFNPISPSEAAELYRTYKTSNIPE